jgi:hypothetical protein
MATALSSMDSWMESLIKKKQKKKGQTQMTLSAESSYGNMDPFEELEYYLKHPWLWQEDCPNPIPWWGVCVFPHCCGLY